MAAQQIAEKGEDEGDQDPDQLLLQKQNYLQQLQGKDDQLVINKKKLVRFVEESCETLLYILSRPKSLTTSCLLAKCHAFWPA